MQHYLPEMLHLAFERAGFKMKKMKKEYCLLLLTR